MAVFLLLAAPAFATSPQQRYQEIWQVWAQGDAFGAETQLRAALSRFPDDTRLRFFLAACVASHIPHNEADAYFEPLVGLAARTDRTTIEAQVAEDFLHLSDPKSAASAFSHLTRCVQQNQSDPVLLWVCGQAALRLKKPSQAVWAFELLLRRAKRPPAIVRQAYADALEATGKLQQAQEYRLQIAQEFRLPLPKRST